MNFIKRIITNSDPILWLTLVTALGYGLYCGYYVGRMSFYNAPPTIFLKLNPVSLAGILISMFAWMPVYFAFLYVKGFLDKNILNRSLPYVIGFAIFLSVVVVVFLFIFNITGLLSKTESILFATFFLLTLNFIIGSYFKRNLYLIFSSIFLFIIGAYLIGGLLAESKESYYVVEEDKENTYVVLANTEDMAMIAPVDLNHGIITPEFQFIEVKSDLENKIKFKYKHTGKLTVEN